MTKEQSDDEEVVELQGMWYFILPNEEAQEELPIGTNSRSHFDFPQKNSK